MLTEELMARVRAICIKRLRRCPRMKGIVVHHTAGRQTASVADINKVHVNERGFVCIGYHYLVHLRDGEWTASRGRLLPYYGAHCPGRQDHIGLALAGNYEAVEPPGEAIEYIVTTIASLLVEHGLSISDVTYHRQHKSSTACPGKHIIERWPYILEEVAARLPI